MSILDPNFEALESLRTYCIHHHIAHTDVRMIDGKPTIVMGKGICLDNTINVYSPLQEAIKNGYGVHFESSFIKSLRIHCSLDPEVYAVLVKDKHIQNLHIELYAWSRYGTFDTHFDTYFDVSKLLHKGSYIHHLVIQYKDPWMRSSNRGRGGEVKVPGSFWKKVPNVELINVNEIKLGAGTMGYQSFIIR